MAFLRNIRNSLFGQDNTTQAETASMLGSKLAKSSKLTTSANNLPLEQDPLEFKFHTYPDDLNTLSNGHYIKFDIYQNNLAKIADVQTQNDPFDYRALDLLNTSAGDISDSVFRVSKAVENKNNSKEGYTEEGTAKIKKTGVDMLDSIKISGLNKARNVLKNKTPTEINESLDLHSHTHSKMANGSIILYTPSSNKFSTGANYENAETGFLSDFLGGSNLFDALSTGLTSAGTKLAGATITAALEIMVPGAGGFFNRSTGMSVNPNMELAFKSVPFRPFTFEYKFAPKNKRELDSVHKIIQLFRFHMSPALIGTTQYFAAPSQFQLTYMYKEKENNYIPKIAKCVLENIEVDYSPGDKFTTLKPDGQGASPQLINVQMQFKEMSIITKETIAEGY